MLKRRCLEKSEVMLMLVRWLVGGGEEDDDDDDDDDRADDNDGV